MISSKSQHHGSNHAPALAGVARRGTRGRRFAWLLIPAAGLAVGCEHTAEGIRQDTLAAKASANETADSAKHSLDSEMTKFKADANAQLERLSGELSAMGGKVQNGVDDSSRGAQAKVQEEIDKTRASLDQLKANSQSEWQKTKADVNANLAELGRKVNGALDKAGDKVEKALQ